MVQTRLAQLKTRQWHLPAATNIIRLKWLIEKLDRPLHCIQNLGRRPNLWDLNKVAVPLAGCNRVESGHQLSVDLLKVDVRQTTALLRNRKQRLKRKRSPESKTDTVERAVVVGAGGTLESRWG